MNNKYKGLNSNEVLKMYYNLLKEIKEIGNKDIYENMIKLRELNTKRVPMYLYLNKRGLV